MTVRYVWQIDVEGVAPAGAGVAEDYVPSVDHHNGCQHRQVMTREQTQTNSPMPTFVTWNVLQKLDGTQGRVGGNPHIDRH